MDTSADNQFREEFIVKTLAQQSQFEQWLRFFFFLNQKLSEEYDTVYQDSFYVKLYELLTEGLLYASKVQNHLESGISEKKKTWYRKLCDGLNGIKSALTSEETNYVEYRRHNASHIFQNQYEHIQEDLKIKKVRKGVELSILRKQIEGLILQHGSDRGIDDYINGKIGDKVAALYLDLNDIYHSGLKGR